MKRFAYLKDDAGRKTVRAVIEWSQETPPPAPGQEAPVLVPASIDKDRIIGCLYQDGQFIREKQKFREMRAAQMSKRKVTQLIWCYHDFSYGNSLGHVGRESVRWLLKQGVPIKVMSTRPGFPISPPGPIAHPSELPNSAVIVMDRHPVPDALFETLKDAAFVAGYYMVEGSKVRVCDIDRLEGYDAIFTPSLFCKKAMEDSHLATPVYVWGHGFDHEMLPYVAPRPNRPFTFLWFGDENRRKGYDLFLSAFSCLKVPNVRAWVRGPGSGTIAKVADKYRQDKRIVWDTKVTPPETLRQLMAEVDVLVLPCRGEGFGLTALEAMAAGRPALMTKWSGPVDFGGDDTMTYWLDVKKFEAAQNDGGVQAVPDEGQLASKMEWCAVNWGEVRERGVRVSREMHSKWRWEQKVMEVIPILQQLVPHMTVRP